MVKKFSPLARFWLVSVLVVFLCPIVLAFTPGESIGPLPSGSTTSAPGPSVVGPTPSGSTTSAPGPSGTTSTTGTTSSVDTRPIYERIVPPSSEDVLTPGFATSGTPSFAGLMNFLFDLLVRRVLPLLVGVMVLFIVWGGFQYILAGGDPAKIKQARDLILYTLIAMILALSALTIVTILNNLLSQATP